MTFSWYDLLNKVFAVGILVDGEAVIGEMCDDTAGIDSLIILFDCDLSKFLEFLIIDLEIIVVLLVLIWYLIYEVIKEKGIKFISLIGFL